MIEGGDTWGAKLVVGQVELLEGVVASEGADEGERREGLDVASRHVDVPGGGLW